MAFHRIISATLCIGILLFAAACERLTARGTSSSGSTGGTNSNDGVTGLFSVSVQLRYEGTSGSFTEAGSCSIAGGSALAATNSCTITIPEGQLYYSDLKFVVTTGVDTCPLVTFSPYYYQADATNPWNPNWDTAANADCTGALATLVPACFSGAAVDVLTTAFPAETSTFSVLGSGTSATWTISSSHSVDPAYSNRRVANNLSTASRATTFGIGAGDGYVMNTMQDYQFECQDSYLFTSRTITLVIDDDDVDSNGGANDIDDWKAY